MQCISGMHSTFVPHGAPTGELAAVAALLPQQPEVEAKRPNYFVQKSCDSPEVLDQMDFPMDDQSPPSHLGDGRSLMGSMKIHHKSIMNYFLNKYVTSAGAAVIECQSRRSSEEVGHSSRSVAA